MPESTIIYIVIATVLLTAFVVCLFLRQQKKAVMDEVKRLTQRLAEMETKVASPPTQSPIGERGASSGEENNNPPVDEILDLSAMNNEELFAHISNIIRDKEMFRRPTLNRKALMEHFSLSAARIGNAFVRGGGMSLPEFVRNCRLDYACHLMVEQPEMSFTEVSHQSGYHRTTTFYHDFKACFEMSPTEFREQELSEQTPPGKQ